MNALSSWIFLIYFVQTYYPETFSFTVSFESQKEIPIEILLFYLYAHNSEVWVSQAHARSIEVSLSHSHRGQGHMYLDHHLLPLRLQSSQKVDS